MHKTNLNSEEIKLIKGSNKIIDKIGLFPDMEDARLESFNYRQSNELENYIDVEFVYDISNWINSLDIAKRTILKSNNNDIDSNYLHPYLHKDFDERKIRILFLKF